MTIMNTHAGFRSILFGALCITAGFSAIAPAQADKTVIAYKPGVSIVPEVLLSDGQTPRTYNTTSGLSIWTNTLPVVQGDKVKINVFAATGGVELKEIIVRLDNTKIADLPAAPWKTVLDTVKLGPGYHMIEVWAQSAGDHPQSTTQTLSFYVSQQLAAQYVPQPAAIKVAPSLQQGTGGVVENLPLPGETDTASDTAPTLDYLKGKTTDSNAQVAVYARSSTSGVAAGAGNGTLVTGATITVNEPTVLAVQPTPDSTATQFAYAMMRGDRVIYTAPNAYSASQFQVRIEKLDSATGRGLASGAVTLWVWGINKAGQPSDPVKTVLNIP